jgi:hypothetical protein
MAPSAEVGKGVTRIADPIGIGSGLATSKLFCQAFQNKCGSNAKLFRYYVASVQGLPRFHTPRSRNDAGRALNLDECRFCLIPTIYPR